MAQIMSRHRFNGKKDTILKGQTLSISYDRGTEIDQILVEELNPQIYYNTWTNCTF